MPTAIHLDGGNYFDDMRIDIQAAHEQQDEWLKQIKRTTVRKPLLVNYYKLASFVLLRKLGLYEAFVNNGLIGEWFYEFQDYWSNVLHGRPITIMDFHQLRFLYRTRNQNTKALSWQDHRQHIENWQHPNGISFTFDLLYRNARNPVRSRQLWKLLKPGMRVLEYGCAVAPMYRTWKGYLNHIETEWVLADLPNFPFHYTHYTCAKDKEATFNPITADLLDEPLKNSPALFDMIVVQEVFEHLHHPRHMAEYLLAHLKSGGLLYFDYVRSEAVGYDTPLGLTERIPTLEYLGQKLKLIHGNFHVSDRSLGTCVGVKV